MLVKIVRKCTIELPDGSAGLFPVGMEVDLVPEGAERLVKRGEAIDI